jgi:hypothetical protein
MPRSSSAKDKPPNQDARGIELAQHKKKLKNVREEVANLKRSVKTGDLNIELLKKAIEDRDELMKRLVNANNYLTRTAKSEDE